MAMTWWGIEMLCPACKVLGTNMSAWFAADGELMFCSSCPKCDVSLQYPVYASHLAWLAHDRDEEKKANATQKIQTRAKAVRPPLAISAPLITPEDKQFERECGIDPSEET